MIVIINELEHTCCVSGKRKGWWKEWKYKRMGKDTLIQLQSALAQGFIRTVSSEKKQIVLLFLWGHLQRTWSDHGVLFCQTIHTLHIRHPHHIVIFVIVKVLCVYMEVIGNIPLTFFCQFIFNQKWFSILLCI